MNEFNEFLKCIYTAFWASQVVLVVKNPLANAGDVGSVPGLVRSPGGGHGDPLQYCCLEKTMDRGARWTTVHGFARSWMRLKQLSPCACTLLFTSFPKVSNQLK